MKRILRRHAITMDELLAEGDEIAAQVDKLLRSANSELSGVARSLNRIIKEQDSSGYGAFGWLNEQLVETSPKEMYGSFSKLARIFQKILEYKERMDQLNAVAGELEE